MKRAILFVLLLSWSVAALAVSVTATINPYPTPAGHTIRIHCKINTGDWFRLAKFDASKTKITKDMAIKNGDKIQCKLQAKNEKEKIKELKYSGWSPVYTFIYKAKVIAPKKIIKITVN